jgi:hypothetical protein
MGNALKGGKIGLAKVGGAKGGGGKGGGKKGGGKKSGQGCPSGQVTLCLLREQYDVITAAFRNAISSRGKFDGCEAGLMRVCLDFSIAQKLMFTIFNASQGITKTKKKKGKGQKTLLGKTGAKGKVRKGA